MTAISIFGATGYAGSHIAAEALSRDINVTGIARTQPAELPAGIVFRTGSIEDPKTLDAAAADADVLVSAVPAAIGETPWLIELVPALLDACAKYGTRLGVVGGAGSLLLEPGGPALYDTPGFLEVAIPEAKAHGLVLQALQASESDVDWFYLSPGSNFYVSNPGERTGSFRLGGDVVLTDADGVSMIGGADYAIAFVDEIERPAHHQERFTVAY